MKDVNGFHIKGGKMENIRAFIGIDIPDTIKNKIGIITQSLKETGHDVKWVDNKNIHLTLQFLGDIPVDDIPDIVCGLKRIRKKNKPINIKLAGLGVFPNFYHIKVIWMGLKKGKKELEDLHQELQHPLKQLGIEGEQRKFSPHLTLGRKKSQMVNPELVKHIKEFPGDVIGEFSVNELVLYKSILLPRGPKYIPLEKISLLKNG